MGEEGGSVMDSDGQRYQLKELLVQERCGNVYRGLDHSTGGEVAVYVINLQETDDSQKDIQKLVTFLSQTPNLAYLPSYRKSFVNSSDDHLWIVRDHVDGVSLHEQLKLGNIGEAYIAIILRETLRGLKEMHSFNIMHRNLKAASLVHCSSRIKLINVGVAGRHEAGEKKHNYTYVSSLHYIAPEVLTGQGYTDKADVWSLGITAIELATGEPPRASESGKTLLNNIVKEEAPRLHGDFSREFKDFVVACLNKDPLERPSVRALLRHPFIRHSKKRDHLLDMKEAWDHWRKNELESSGEGTNKDGPKEPKEEPEGAASSASAKEKGDSEKRRSRSRDRENTVGKSSRERRYSLRVDSAERGRDKEREEEILREQVDREREKEKEERRKEVERGNRTERDQGRDNDKDKPKEQEQKETKEKGKEKEGEKSEDKDRKINKEDADEDKESSTKDGNKEQERKKDKENGEHSKELSPTLRKRPRSKTALSPDTSPRMERHARSSETRMTLAHPPHGRSVPTSPREPTATTRAEPPSSNTTHLQVVVQEKEVTTQPNQSTDDKQEQQHQYQPEQIPPPQLQVQQPPPQEPNKAEEPKEDKANTSPTLCQRVVTPSLAKELKKLGKDDGTRSALTKLQQAFEELEQEDPKVFCCVLNELTSAMQRSATAEELAGNTHVTSLPPAAIEVLEAVPSQSPLAHFLFTRWKTQRSRTFSYIQEGTHPYNK
ncbi:Serine/threonine-protein kinase PAK 6 [Balamuthia mandrillaris]